MRSIVFEILGNPQSKANSRTMVFRGKKPRSIKSKAALSYVEAFQYQCPKVGSSHGGLLRGDLSLTLDIWYQSWRSDLDESIIMDAMQGLIYDNDRQIKVKLVTHKGVDKTNPRCVVKVEELTDAS